MAHPGSYRSTAGEADGYSAINHRFDPPSPHSQPIDLSRSIPIPGGNMSNNTPIAGPSSEGALNRRTSEDLTPLSPSSAPAVPSVVAVAHPSLYIHTHHPRRGSMTPLGLNVISPVPPNPNNPAPMRHVGFTPDYQPYDRNGTDRRGSAASNWSQLTQTRPNYTSNSSYPAGFSRERRRSSLTPSIPTLAPPSPSRTHASGKSTRPSSSDGSDQPPVHVRTRTAEHAPRHLLAEDSGRRGSMPHLNYGGWNGHAPRVWNPSLPPPRSSVGEDNLGPNEGFKFGSGGPGPSAAAAALKQLDISRRSSAASKKPMNAFEELEFEEAEKQRRAFFDATYGTDGFRARERLSFASGSGGQQSPGNLRRTSLALWEKISMTSRPTDSPITAMTDPVSLPSLSAAKSLEDLGPRRGSLPVAIPGSGLGRTPSRRRDVEPPSIVGPDDQVDDLEEAADEDVKEHDFNSLSPPQRPLPPLLPLSDPGPRLLPSTLALHRANHLLNSRNLQAEPLPHPLPPSLHPPAPVDLAEFDIDFILAGSQAQLGGESVEPNVPVDALHQRPAAAPILRLGDEEDSFAKFVGEFDDEYGGRRGDWTFRVCPSRYGPSTGSKLRAEWDCSGAGKYELYSNGDVRSIETGSVWRVRKSGSREYELAERDTSSAPGSCFLLAPKNEHAEVGGVKLRSVPHPQLRVSLSDQPGPERSNRIGSADSAATARAVPSGPSSLPIVSAITPRKKLRQPSKGEDESQRLSARGRGSISGPSSKNRSESRDRLGDLDEKKKGGIGGALKRAFKNTLAANEEKRAAKEEREREKMQSQSWSPSGSRSKDYVHPSGKGFADKQDRNQVKTAPAAMHERKNRSPSDTNDIPRPPPASWLSTASAPARPKSAPRDSNAEEGSLREGKAWKGVPEEAVAMVIPIEDDGIAPPMMPSQTRRGGKFTKQALLVWYVPFISEGDERSVTAASSISSRQSSEPVPALSGSLPKLQKLLRRRASKDKEAIKRDREGLMERLNVSNAGSVTNLSIDGKVSCALHPLPFRSFRVVARVVDIDDLKSESGSMTASIANSRSSSNYHGAPSSLGSIPSPSLHTGSLPSTDENEASSVSTAPTSTVSTGRTFPTVIAVCHSRSQGVEFVLEGLDRLGFCQGDSAWGPTGYEEWRGTGLSGKGREFLDLLWAGCVGVMGLTGM